MASLYPTAASPRRTRPPRLDRSARAVAGLACAVLCLTGPARAAEPKEAPPWTADRIARRAVETAPSVRAARAARQAAEAASARQRLALWPRLELSGSYTRLSRVDQKQLSFGQEALFGALARAISELDDGGQLSAPTQAVLDGLLAPPEAEGGQSNPFPQILNRYTLRASLSYPVSDAWLRIWPAYRASQAQAQARAQQARVERRQVALSAREAYYQLQGARAGLKVAEAQLANVEAQLKQTRAFVEAGTLPKVDAMRMSAQRDAAVVAVERARGLARIAERALRTLLHLPTEQPLRVARVAGGEVAAPEGSLAALVEEAIRSRPEVRALLAALRARGLAYKSARRGQAPSLSLAASADLSNPNARVIPQEATFKPSADISVVLSWSPNDFTRARRDMREADAQRVQAEADLAALHDAVRLEVGQRYEELRSSLAALRAADSAARAAEESHRVRQARFKAGAAVPSELIDAEQELTQARVRQVQATLDAQLARARLDYATGR